MSGLLPEKPILFYPSLAARYGTDEAILLAVYHEFAEHHGAANAQGDAYFILRRSEWAALIDFWDEERIAMVTGSLVNQGVLSAELNRNSSLTVTLFAKPKSQVAGSEAADELLEWGGAPSDAAVAVEPGAERIPASPQAAPYRESETPDCTVRVQARARAASRASEEGPPPTSQQLTSQQPRVASTSLQQADGGPLAMRGPAPTFGGSTGWSRNADELEALFAQREARNQQLHEMYPDWQPADTTYEMLKRHQIPADFADQRIDEFIAYWLERDRREVSWDHHFLKLVKREWVKEQSRQARETRMGDQAGAEVHGERYQTDNRTGKRKQITDALLDIQNLDWI